MYSPNLRMRVTYCERSVLTISVTLMEPLSLTGLSFEIEVEMGHYDRKLQQYE